MDLLQRILGAVLPAIFFGCCLPVEHLAHAAEKHGAAIGALTVHLRVDKDEVQPRESFTIVAEVVNDGSANEPVYMPGIIGSVVFEPHKNGPVRPDEFGPPLGLSRSAASEVDLDFVNLQPGDFYGRRHLVTAPSSPCDIHLNFSYVNNTRRDGARTGRSKAVEVVVRVRSWPEGAREPSSRGEKKAHN